MIRLGALVFLVLAASLSAAPGPKELKREDFVGAWKIEALQSNGGTPVGDHWTLESNGDSHAHRSPVVPDGAVAPHRLSFDPSARSVDFIRISDGRITRAQPNSLGRSGVPPVLGRAGVPPNGTYFTP